MPYARSLAALLRPKPFKGKLFRIGHLGHFNELMLAGTLSGVEMGLTAAGVPFKAGRAGSSLGYLAGLA